MGKKALKLAFIKKRFSVHGGAEKYLQTLIKEFLKEGHEIHIFANQWEEEKGLTFHRVDVSSFPSFMSVLSFNRYVCQAIQEGFDCVISLERTTCQDIYRAGEGCHAEWLEIRSDIEPFFKKLSFFLNPLHRSLLLLEKRLFTETKLIIANSKMVKANIIKHYNIPENKIRIIYNGVDLERFSHPDRERVRKSKRNNLAISPDSRVLLFVGSGFRRKGLPTLMEAVSLLKDEDIITIVVGRGEAREYKNLAQNYGIKNKIMFTGPQKEIEAFYCAADIFILPTLYDPFSNATLEAMASGLPVITTRNNGAADLIESGREGYVLEDPRDAHELAGRIRILLTNHAYLGEQAREKAGEFPVKKAINEFADAINSIRTVQ